ncbi:MAG: hypothetical protein LBS08_03570, partial [Candidatus Symbiothrix sp.]|nr:hypothetical protein [Candidatus Symbiothrix sp.]
MLRISQCYVVLKGHYFHNRRSSTCGERMVIPLLPERQDFRTLHQSYLSGSSLCLLPYRRSM